MIQLYPSARQIMETDARNAYPDECCGFMYGAEAADGNRDVTVAVPVHNSATENRKRRFEVSAKDYMQAERYAIDNNLQLLGVYHSHPNHPAIPSEHDRVAAQPWFSYVIISVIDGQVDHSRSWRLNDNNQFEEETIGTHAGINQ